jgi:hypothetical protein
MRLKVIAGNLAVVVLLGLAAYLFVGGQLRDALLASVDSRITSDRQLFERSLRLSALEFQALVGERAAERALRDVFGGLDVVSRRTRGFEAAEATAAWLADPARGMRGPADIVVIVDETGSALARNGARNVLFGKSLTAELPALARALESGRPTHDVWHESQEKKLLETAIAPIRADSGTILGALVVGYDLSTGFAKREAALLGRDVAFILDGHVYSSSLSGNASRDLQSRLSGSGSDAETTKRIASGQASVSPVWNAKLDNADYVGVTARVPLATSVGLTYAVLANRTAQLAAADVVNVILILTVLGSLLVIFYGFVIGNFIMRPIEAIEEGVLAVINGRTDLRLETQSAELGGLAFRINQLLNVLTGTEETSSDAQGRVSVPPSAGAWKDAAFTDPGTAAPQASSPNPDEPIDDEALAARLSAEDGAAYETRVYDEYVAAKQAVGENVTNIPKDRFHQRLSGRASALAQKHGCRAVRFQVETVASQVVLRPVLLR